MFTLDLSSEEVMKSVSFNEVGGKKVYDLNSDALNIIGKNVSGIVKNANDSEITLTGANAIPVYLVAFHIVVHKFKRVYFQSPTTAPILISQH